MKIVVRHWHTLEIIPTKSSTLHEIIDEILTQNLNVMIIKHATCVVVWIDSKRFRQS